MGPPDRRDPQGQALQRGASGRRGQPRGPDGSKAAHTGQLVTRDDILGNTHEFAPTVDKLTVIGEGPLKVGLYGALYRSAARQSAAPGVLSGVAGAPGSHRTLRRLRPPFCVGPAGLSWGTTLTWSWFKNESETTRAPAHYSRPCQVHRDQVDPGGQRIVLADVTARSWKVEVDASKRDC